MTTPGAPRRCVDFLHILSEAVEPLPSRKPVSTYFQDVTCLIDTSRKFEKHQTLKVELPPLENVSRSRAGQLQATCMQHAQPRLSLPSPQLSLSTTSATSDNHLTYHRTSFHHSSVSSSKLKASISSTRLNQCLQSPILIPTARCSLLQSTTTSSPPKTALSTPRIHTSPSIH